MSVRRLPGASSTAVHAVRLADGTVLVLRRYVWEKFRIEEPEAPAREVEALEYASRHGLVVPAVIAADPDGAEVGDGIPALLMARVPGRAQPAPDVHALAALAAQVHALSGAGFGHRYFPWCRDTSTAPRPGLPVPGQMGVGARAVAVGGAGHVVADKAPDWPTRSASCTGTSTPATCSG